MTEDVKFKLSFKTSVYSALRLSSVGQFTIDIGICIKSAKENDFRALLVCVNIHVLYLLCNFLCRIVQMAHSFQALAKYVENEEMAIKTYKMKVFL